MFNNLSLAKPLNHFTVGITDDVTKLSLPLPSTPIHTVPAGTHECCFWGMGSDGTVGANKSAIKIIGKNTDLYAQGYFSYDAHKSGGVTVSHLRFGPTPITSTYLIQNADYVACHHPFYFEKFNLLKNLKQGGTFVMNTAFGMAEIEKHFPNSLKLQMAQKKVKFYTIDAGAIAKACGLGKRINMVMQSVFFKLTPVIPYERANELLKKAIVKDYGKKGEKIVKANSDAVDHAAAGVKLVEVPKEWANLKPEVKAHSKDLPEFVTKIMMPMQAMEGDSLPVSAFQAGGRMPMGTTKYEKRNIAPAVPIWDPASCSQCNQCAFTCPHAAIRPFLEPNDFKCEDKPGLLLSLCLFFSRFAG